MTIVEVSQALSTPVIATLGLWIAYQQWRTNHNRLKLELFERRYAIYRAAADFLDSILSSGEVTSEAQAAYIRGIQGARILYGPIVADHLHEIWSDAVNHEMSKYLLKDLSVGEERRVVVDKLFEIKIRLPGRLKQLDDLVTPYIAMKGVR